MIKKFNEYLKESRLGDFITKEDIEDQFLRLEEVFSCKVSAYSLNSLDDTTSMLIFVMCKDRLNNEEIENEISCIKSRIELMYPPIKVGISDRKKISKLTYEISIRIW